MKKLAAALVMTALLLSLVVTGAMADGDKIKVGYDIYFLGNSWSVQLYQEFKYDVENKFADQIEVTYVESEGDISKQIANLEDLIAQEVDVIITTPNDTTALNATLQDAMDEGIKVILLAAGIDGDCYDNLVTVDEVEFGRVGAQWIVDQLGGKGKVICLNGISGLSTSELRYQGAKSVFDALGADTYVINNHPDGLNVNLNCGSTHIEGLRNYVKANGLDVGFAFDGDADRCLAVDKNGEEVNGDKIMYLCAKYMRDKGQLGDTRVVTTVMSNFCLYKALDELGIGYEKTAVGDRYVYENMVANGHLIGG